MRQLASPAVCTFAADLLPTACRMLRGLLIGAFAAMRLRNMPVPRMAALIHAGFLPGFFSRPGAVFPQQVRMAPLCATHHPQAGPSHTRIRRVQREAKKNRIPWQGYPANPEEKNPEGERSRNSVSARLRLTRVKDNRLAK